MQPVIPSLSPHGWISDPIIQGNVLLQHYFLSNHSQSRLYGDNVASISKDLQTGGEDAQEAILPVIKDTLIRYFSQYFHTVECTVHSEPNELDKIHMSLYYRPHEGDDEINLQYAIKETNGFAQELIEYNNYGEILSTINVDLYGTDKVERHRE